MTPRFRRPRIRQPLLKHQGVRGTSSPPTALDAAKSVLGVFPALGAAVAGATVLALFAGWRDANSYFSDLGVPWVVPLLSPSMLIARVAGLLVLLIVSAFFSIYGLSQGDSSAKSLRRISIITLGVATAFYMAALIEPLGMSTAVAYLCTLAAAWFSAVSAGLTIGEVVARLLDSDLKWDSYYVWLLYLVVFIALMQAPSQLGWAKARYDLDPASGSLTRVFIQSGTQQESWRMVVALGGQFLLMSPPGHSNIRTFRLVNAESVTIVKPLAGNR